MFKKMILVAVVGGLAVAAFKGTRFASYVRHEIKGLRDAADDSIPLEKRVVLLEEGVNKLDRHVLKKIKEVSEVAAGLKLADDDVTVLADKQAARKKQLDDRLAAVEADAAKGQPVGTADRRLADLDRDTANWEANQKVLAGLTANRDTLKQHVAVLDEQLKTMVAERDAMKVRVRALKVEVERVKLQQLQSRTPAGDSETATMKAEFRDLEKRLLAEQEALKRMPLVEDAAPAAVRTTATLGDIKARLNGKGNASPND